MRSTWRFCKTQSLKQWRTFPARAQEPAVAIRTLSHTLYALLATLTTGRSLRLVQRVPVETVGGRERAVTRGSEILDAQFVLLSGMSDNPAEFDETWKSWEHQVDVCENLSSTKLEDVKISVVLCKAPQKLRDHLLVKSQQFE